MKRLLQFIPYALIILFIQQNALGAEPYKIAVMDLQRCLNDSNEGKRHFQSLKKKKDALQKKLDEQQKELLKLQKELEKQSLMLSLDAREGKQKDYERKRRDLGYLIQDLNEEMNRAGEKAKKKILKDLEGIVEKIAEKDNYLLILERRTGGVVYFSDTVDITEEVIKEYNKMKP